jgi:3-oxoadipate enol-lactonase
MDKVRVNDIDIAYRIERAGSRAPWLVFSHSLACDHTMWQPQVGAFARRYNLLLFDTRGHGQSSAPAGDYTLETLADDVIGLLDALAIERCHFVGLSMGGMIGQVAALRSPQRFATLTLADTTSRYPLEARPVWEQRIATVRARGIGAIVEGTLERWFTAPFRAREAAVVERIAGLIRATPVAGYVGCAAGIARIDLTARLSQIKLPVLVLVGAEDPGTPPAMAKEIAQAISGAQLVLIPGAAHLSNIEQPQAFNAALDEFLRKHG